MGVDIIENLMSNSKMTIIFISEVSRSNPRLEPNEIFSEVLVKKEEIGIYSRARPTKTKYTISEHFLRQNNLDLTL